MYLVKVSDFLKMDGVPPSHEQLQSRGLLHEWSENMFVTFISHQWCGSKHADPNGLQTSVLRRGLRGLINGTVELEQNIVGTIYALAPDWSSATREQLANGYLFLDWFAIPEIGGCNESGHLAVQSIPFYVEVCNLFIVLAPEIVHEDTGALCNYSSWLSRGWCRGELWYRMLSSRRSTSIMVMFSEHEVECMSHLDWKNNRVGEGDFTEEADRMVLTALGSEAMERKLEFLKNDLENLHWFRFYTAFQSWILGQDLKKWDDLSEFLEDFHFNSVEDATSGDDKMFGLLCAVLAGDTGMVQQLVRLRADVHRKAFGLGEMGYYNSMTPLMIACMSNQSAEMLTTLLDLNANVHDRSFAGVNSAFLARSPQQVQVLLDAGADFSGQRLPAGLAPLVGVGCYANSETMEAMLSIAKCDPNGARCGIGWGPLHAVATFSRGNKYAVPKAQLLLENRADINARCCMSGPFQLISHAARLHVSLWGLERSAVKLRFFASSAGITPLGLAAMMGDHALVKLLLSFDADPKICNERGDTPADLALVNGHRRAYEALMST